MFGRTLKAKFYPKAPPSKHKRCNRQKIYSKSRLPKVYTIFFCSNRLSLGFTFCAYMLIIKKTADKPQADKDDNIEKTFHAFAFFHSHII